MLIRLTFEWNSNMYSMCHISDTGVIENTNGSVTMINCKNLRLHSFLSVVMEDNEDTLILPSWRVSTGLACIRKRL